MKNQLTNQKNIAILFFALLTIVNVACGPSTDKPNPSEIPEVLLDKVWYWQEFQDTLGYFDIEVDAPTRYKLELMANGDINVQADCNRGGGSYNLNKSRLNFDFTSGMWTLANCGPDSLDGDFMSRLGEVVTYELQDGKLYLKMNGGVIVFGTEGN